MRTNAKIGTVVTVLALGSMMFVSSCKKDNMGGAPGAAPYNMYMTDAPAAAYQQVNVNIVGAEVHSDVSGWVKLNVHTGIYNLLTLSNGKDTLLASGNVAAGNVSQIRLIIGSTGNTVMVNGAIYPLVTPSAQETGIKLNVNSSVVTGVTYNITIDFDAGMSVVAEGNGTYSLKPVIRAVVSPSTSGTIRGAISPSVSQATIIAVSSDLGAASVQADEMWNENEMIVTDSASSFSLTGSGNFEVRGLAAGNYQVTISPLPPLTAITVSNITVASGQVTEMGTVMLQ